MATLSLVAAEVSVRSATSAALGPRSLPSTAASTPRLHGGEWKIKLDNGTFESVEAFHEVTDRRTLTLQSPANTDVGKGTVSPVSSNDDREQEDAKELLRETTAETAELEKKLALLPGKANRKERHEVNQLIVALKNKPEVLAAERLVRHPSVERRRRQRLREEKATEDLQRREVQDVVRSRLRTTLSEAANGRRFGAETWHFLLREAKAVGLDESDDAMCAVIQRLDAFRAEAKLLAHVAACEEDQVPCDNHQEDEENLIVSDQAVLIVEEEHKPHQRRHHPQQGLQNLEASHVYKTALCNAFDSNGFCYRGSSCGYAHGLSELRPRKEGHFAHKAASIRQRYDGLR